MKGSKLSPLSLIPVIVLAAGHGGTDPGACHGTETEREQTIRIVERMKQLLTPLLPPGAVVIAPHSQDTHQTVPWLNERFPTLTSAWVLEIHRDSAPKVKGADAAFRCGVYHGDGRQSQAVADHLAHALRAHGAHGPTTWSRNHRSSRFKNGLLWINGPRAFSHLLELGFMESGDTHLDALALTAAAAVYETFTGQPWPADTAPPPPAAAPADA